MQTKNKKVFPKTLAAALFSHFQEELSQGFVPRKEAIKEWMEKLTNGSLSADWKWQDIKVKLKTKMNQMKKPKRSKQSCSKKKNKSLEKK